MREYVRPGARDDKRDARAGRLVNRFASPANLRTQIISIFLEKKRLWSVGSRSLRGVSIRSKKFDRRSFLAKMGATAGLGALGLVAGGSPARAFQVTDSNTGRGR